MTSMLADLPLDPETAYNLKRAKEERARALAADNIWARAAHHELSAAYERRLWRRNPQMIALLPR